MGKNMGVETVEEKICSVMSGGRQTLATAESCTGGLVAHRLTNVPGASDYFVGGVVAYSNDAKVALLGVDRAALAEHGAVSEVVARQMARGARNRFDADYGVGITGIAGPGGGSETKPVGLVYIAVAGPEEVWAGKFVFSGTREEIKSQAAGAALTALFRLWRRTSDN